MEAKTIERDFYSMYGNPEDQALLFFSPGRVNLIGEHTDYNDGYVFPCALDFGTYLAIRKRSDHKLKFASKDFDYTAEIPVDEVSKKRDNKWINYPMGIMSEFQNQGIELSGLEFLFGGEIPNGAGLSSSASIEMVTALALNTLFNAQFSILDLIKLSKSAENNYVGVNCGIMDQFAVGLGENNKAIMLDCGTLDYESVPVNIEGYKLVISNTNVKRELAGSKFNERWSECGEALKYLQNQKSINALGELDIETFEALRHTIPSEIIQKRAQHVVYEDDRVLKAVNALKHNDLHEFGNLMNQSHDSLRDDYEVTGKELDTLVDEARKIEGVLGSRMTGAGFGGCTVSLVKESQVSSFKEQVGEAYKQETGLQALFYVANIGDGVKQL